LVPKPRVHLTYFHGVFAPHSKYRALVTPAKRGKGQKGEAAQQERIQARVTKFDEISEQLREKPLEKLRIQVTQ